MWDNTKGGVMPIGDKNVIVAEDGRAPVIANLYDAMLAARAARERWAHFTAPVGDVVAPGAPVRLAVHVNPGPAPVAGVSGGWEGSGSRASAAV